MTNVLATDAGLRRRRSLWGLVPLVVVPVLALLPLFYFTMLLALSIDEYQSYTASIPEYGDTAAMNADEERTIIVMMSVILVVLWLFPTGLAVAYAALTKGRVLRTVLWVGGGLAVAVGVMLLFGLTAGTA